MNDVVTLSGLTRSFEQGGVRIDVLRGVGVLGMLAVHIQLFAFPSLARWNPTAYDDLHRLNWWAWVVTAILADGKFITIFAIAAAGTAISLAKR